ncbi:hypothetical protein N007_15760 [Alicyclobacillus acidoterrestris ATCC 49025]|nr:hypothetical protein N007_15760 [Alicyclobacillus acidoterrestris ATCC 49025]
MFGLKNICKRLERRLPRKMLRKRTLRSLNTLTAHDRTQLLVLAGVRNAVGVVLPLVVGLLAHQLLLGVGVSVGALVTGFAGMSGTARKRTRTMLLATAWMGVATFIGALAGNISWLIVLCIMASGFIAAMMGALSNEAGQVGLLSTNALLLVSTYPQDPLHAVYRAILVLVGGLCQTLLMLFVDAMSRRSAEAAAVAQVYASLANYARRHTRVADLQLATALLNAETALNDSYMKQVKWQQLRVLTNTAEQIRMYTVALVGMTRGHDNHSGGGASDGIEPVLRALADVVQRLSHVIREQPIHPSDDAQRLQLAVAELKRASDGVAAGEARLYAQEVAVVIARAVDQWTGIVPADRTSAPAKTPLMHQWERAWTVLRANLTLKSTTFRHGIRVIVTLWIGWMLSRWLPLPHGYWLPLTTMIILKPDFTATFSRGIARMAGTVLGICAATWLVQVPDKNHLFGALLILVFAGAMYTMVNYNYALFTCALTGEIIVLLSFFQQQPVLSTMVGRLIATVIGSCLAFGAYILWPSWRHQSVHVALADLIRAQRNYFQAVLARLRDGQGTQVSALRKSARLARTNAVAAVQQAMNEPVQQGWDPHVAIGVLAAMHRFSDVLLALEARLQKGDHPREEDRALLDVGKYIDEALHVMEFAVMHRDVELDADSMERMIAHPQWSHYAPMPEEAISVVARLESIVHTMMRMMPMHRSPQDDGVHVD